MLKQFAIVVCLPSTMASSSGSRGLLGEGIADHAWEQEGYGDPGNSDDAESDFELPPETVASIEFLDHLVDLYLTSTISAKSLCSLCWWASKAGMNHEDIDRLAHKPTDTGGKFQRHVNKAPGFDAMLDRFHKLSVHTYPRPSVGCDITDIPLRPPHELLQEELLDDNTILFKTQEAVDLDFYPLHISTTQLSCQIQMTRRFL